MSLEPGANHQEGRLFENQPHRPPDAPGLPDMDGALIYTSGSIRAARGQPGQTAVRADRGASATGFALPVRRRLETQVKASKLNASNRP